MDFFEVDGYVKDSRVNFGQWWTYWTGIPEPYLLIDAKCRSAHYRVKWFLKCLELGSALGRFRSREDLVFEHYKVHLAKFPAHVPIRGREVSIGEKSCD